MKINADKSVILDIKTSAKDVEVHLADASGNDLTDKIEGQTLENGVLSINLQELKSGKYAVILFNDSEKEPDVRFLEAA